MYLLITIDAEAAHGYDPMKSHMWGHIADKSEDGSKAYGVTMIAEMCERYGMKATYFLDVYAHAYYGKEALRTVATTLDSRGHDVQLHTHPAWFQDKRDHRKLRELKAHSSCFPADKYWMNLNSLDEQIDILHHGKDLLEQWLDKPVIAHRAGAYALDINTIHALQKVGIPVDSSMYHSHPRCKVTWSKNQLVEDEGLLEVPVTVLKREIYWCWGNRIRQKRGSQFVKTDINWCDFADLKTFISEGKKARLPVLNLFLHSYSLIKSDRYFIKFVPDKRAIKCFQEILAFCADDPDIKPVSMRELWTLHQQGKVQFGDNDFVPSTKAKLVNVPAKLSERLADESRRAVDVMRGRYRL